MSNVKLSICIPTYNRAVFLKEALNSIISQATYQIEIVVSDNASTDNTKDIIEESRNSFAHIQYFRWDENMGADRNYLKVIELAKGEYCWWLGSDDALMDGAVSVMLETVSRGYDFVFTNIMGYDIDLKIPNNKVLTATKHNTPDMTLTSIGSWITYLSAICIKREFFMQNIEVANLHVGTMLSFCYPVASIIFRNNNYIIDKPLVKYRAGNTSGYNFYRVFIEEYQNLMYYCESIGYDHNHIRANINNNFKNVVLPLTVNLKLGSINLDKSKALVYFTKARVSLWYKARFIITIFTPSMFFKLLILMKRAVKTIITR
jgi:glycosyltransferase involved in cell wall biosynthesis